MNTWAVAGRPRAALALAAVLASAALGGCELRGSLQFSPASLPEARLGTPYSATITVSDNATPVGGAEIAEGALPPGLDLTLSSGATIEIAGTPTASGTFNFTVSVWCYGTNVSGQTGSQEYALVVR